ncbi:hypothetical protein [Halorhodospira halochloris]|uniref:hypothetical protein n=1 Tax=Halorhodospira halochloris TaxID=1052 RepID=UPI001EE998BD|nr:hypothetical protein [Halorhodospira halochloris]MCG5549485.1 hypothetical protein [Halorhodospira halochloris]
MRTPPLWLDIILTTKRRFQRAADGNHLLWITPACVERVCYRSQLFEIGRRDSRLHYRHKGFLVPGDWDLRARPISIDGDFPGSQKYAKLADLVRCADDFRQSLWYAEARQQLQDEGRFVYKSRHIMTDLDSLDRFFENYLVKLIVSLRTEGYLPESAQGEHCGVAIGRDGDLLLTERGRHRFFVAHLLGLQSILVEVRRAHSEWFRKVGAGFHGAGKQRLQQALQEVGDNHRA